MGSKPVPACVYPYRSVVHGLHELLSRPGFEELVVSHWRDREIGRKSHNISSAMMDVYDGRVWKDYQSMWLSPADFKSYESGD